MKKKFIPLICAILFATTSCNNDEDVNLLTDSSVVKKNSSATSNKAISVSCSWPNAGQYMSIPLVTTTYNLGSDQQTDKKYVWRISSSIMHPELGTKIQLKAKLNVAYPIAVRVIGVKKNLLTGAETYTLYKSCEVLTTAGQSSSNALTFWVPTTGSPGKLKPVYTHFDFEVIVLNRNYTGNGSILIPVTISTCRSQGGGC